VIYIPAGVQQGPYSLFFSCSLSSIIRELRQLIMERRYSEKDETFWRRMVLPEEDRSSLTDAEWKGGYRWFRSENVVCLEHYRRPQLLPQRKAS
jgi:hypothetical protein